MSQGNFQLTRYELDGTDGVWPIRLQPETLLLTNGTVANDAPAGPTTLSVSVIARKGNRVSGLGARCISIRWTGQPPTGYQPGGTVQVPILTAAAFAAYTVGSTVTYLGAEATVVGRKNEQRD